MLGISQVTNLRDRQFRWWVWEPLLPSLFYSCEEPMKTKVVKLRKPTPLEELTVSTRKSHSHLHSAAVQAKLDLLNFEANQVEARITNLSAALIEARAQLKRFQAQTTGLRLVLECR
jgi:hypothetical protein